MVVIQIISKPGLVEIQDPGINESFKEWVRQNEYWTNLKYAQIFLDNMGIEHTTIENKGK